MDSAGFNLTVTSLLDFSPVVNMLLPPNPPLLLEFFHLPEKRKKKQVLSFSLGSWNKKSSGVVG